MVTKVNATHYKLFVLTGQSNSLGTTAGGEADPTSGSDPADAHVPFFWDNVVDTTTTSGKSNDIVYGSIEEPVTLTEGEKALLKKQKIQNKFYYIDTVNKNVFNTKYSFVGTLMDNNTIKFK